MADVARVMKDLDLARSADQVSEAINALAEFGELAVPALIEYGRSPDRRRWTLVMRALQQMGYPSNGSALPYIVGQVSNINSPAWDLTLSMLKAIGEPAIPHVRKSLEFYSNDLDRYGDAIQGLCVLLEQLGSPTIDPLAPELLRLLEAGTGENPVDLYAIGPLRRIGSPKADAAIPLLANKIHSTRSGRIRRECIEALEDFDASVIRPLVPILRERLDEDSEELRSSARRILDLLGESSTD